MLKTFQKRDLMVRIFLGFVVGVIGLMMVITLVPGPVGSLAESPNAVADVGGQEVTVAEVRQQLARIEQRQSLPRAVLAFYSRQIIDQLIYERLLELEAKRLGIRVTDEERAELIRRLLPTVFAGGSFVGMEPYAAEVQQRFQMSVPEFEDLVRKTLLEQKFRQLVTDGVGVAPEEVRQEFQRRNEKVKIEYVLIKPDQLESHVPAEDADLARFFEKNKARYQVPERRSIRYALLDRSQLRQRVSVSESELRASYNEHIDRYRLQNRVRVSHILFKTIGKTDAEIEEIRRKAEEVLKKAKRGGNFAELAKQYSEDTTKGAGGDLGWIVQGQTVPEFEHAAFTLPKGAMSDLVKTQYGFHIIKVVDRETARTQSFDEVRNSIVPTITNEKVERLASESADKLTARVRQSNRQPLADIAKEFGLTVTQTPPVGPGDPVGELGKSPELQEVIFRLRPGELSTPIRIDRGYVVLTVEQSLPAHPGTLAEVRDRVLSEYRREKSVELARARADELARRARSGENLAQAAKSLGFEAKSSEPFSRTGSVTDVGSARQLIAAFGLSAGQVGSVTSVASNWVIYRVMEKEEPKPEEFEKQRKQFEQQVLQNKRSLAYEAFRTGLRARLAREGKLRMNEENLKRLTNPNQPATP